MPSVHSLQPSQAVGGDRSIVGTTGGSENHASVEKLPPETAKHFDRDPETNEVIWFSAPPTNDARPSGPQHSLAYLHFLATRRGGGKDGREPDQVQPTLTESIASILKDLDREP